MNDQGVCATDSGESSLENDKETSWEGEDDKMPERVVNQKSETT